MMSWLAAAGVTTMPAWPPKMRPVTVSAAVSDWVPAVFMVAMKRMHPRIGRRESVVGRQPGLAVGAGEVDGAGVDVVGRAVGVLGRDGECAGRARGGRRRETADGDRCPRVLYLENSAQVAGASLVGCAVQVAAAVDDQPGVRSTVEGVERGQQSERTAALGQLENRPFARGASTKGCAVEIAADVHDQTGIRICPVGAVERSQRGQRATALGQLENLAYVAGASHRLCAVEIAAAVHDQRAIRHGTRSQRGDRAAALGQLEHRAAPIQRCTVQIAAAVHDQRRPPALHRWCR